MLLEERPLLADSDWQQIGDRLVTERHQTDTDWHHTAARHVLDWYQTATDWLYTMLG